MRNTASCHPDRAVEGRGLCKRCYQEAWAWGRLDDYPLRTIDREKLRAKWRKAKQRRAAKRRALEVE